MYRGRFVDSMYKQMQYPLLTAGSASHYVDIALRLLLNNSWRNEQSRILFNLFHSQHNPANSSVKSEVNLPYSVFNRNVDAAREWRTFFINAWYQMVS
jgi:hypothetical protein